MAIQVTVRISFFFLFFIDYNISWLSYENKQKRDIIIMIKNLHYSYQPVNILRILSEQGFQAWNATPKLKWKTKETLICLSFRSIEHRHKQNI
jgi:hypothetical protein